MKIELDLSHDELILLGCNALHRANRARKAMYEGFDSAAIANYFALDTNELARFYQAFPKDLIAEIEAAAAASAGEGK